MKIENWNGNKIRFVEINGEWYGVAKDISDALEYVDATRMIKRIQDKYTWTTLVEVQGQTRKMLILNEFGIYTAIFGSRKKEAKEFQDWVFNIIKELRESAEIEVFELLDREHQKQAMQRLTGSLKKPTKVDRIKANTIANKAISDRYGYPKMISKADMSVEMLKEREEILDDTVELMALKDKFNLELSVSREVYKKVNEETKQTA